MSMRQGNAAKDRNRRPCAVNPSAMDGQPRQEVRRLDTYCTVASPRLNIARKLRESCYCLCSTLVSATSPKFICLSNHLNYHFNAPQLKLKESVSVDKVGVIIQGSYPGTSTGAVKLLIRSVEHVRALPHNSYIIFISSLRVECGFNFLMTRFRQCYVFTCYSPIKNLTYEFWSTLV